MDDLSAVVEEVAQLLLITPVQSKPSVRGVSHAGIEFTVNDYSLEERNKLLAFPNINLNLQGLSRIIDPRTPSHEISLSELRRIKDELGYFVPERNQRAFDEFIRGVKDMMWQAGYRDSQDIITFQEHKLLGSTSCTNYEKSPYVPQGIVDGKLTIQEANIARLLAIRMQAHGSYFCVSNGSVNISLELVDENGQTIRDPRLLDENLNPTVTRYSKNFPFRRAA